MRLGKNRRLANVKTRTETGLEYTDSFWKETVKGNETLLPGRRSIACGRIR